MGIVLTPIIEKRTISLEDLRGQTLAVDGNGELYQFLALIRLPDGTPLRDGRGRVTSHLSGLFFRTTRLIAEHALKLVFVFDGQPPPRKAATLEKRRAIKREYERAHAAALERGDLADAYSKATMTSRLTREMVTEARELLRLLGIPTVQAPAEGEAQAAAMARAAAVWAAASKDYDTLLFGAPRLVRFLTISGKEFLPSRGTFRPIVPEVIELDALLAAWKITRGQAIDLAILVGTDFNEGVSGSPRNRFSSVCRFLLLPPKFFQFCRLTPTQTFRCFHPVTISFQFSRRDGTRNGTLSDFRGVVGIIAFNDGYRNLTRGRRPRSSFE